MVLLSVLEIIGMSSQKSKECILQTIDQLRQRKARPDIVRICHMATRKHGMKWQETEAQLEKLVDSGTVVKVEYKGNVSYRNAAKWKKNPFGEKVVKSVSICKKLREAVKDLTKPESDKGSSLKEIEKWLVAHYTDARVEKAQLKFALEKELQNGHLEKHPNGGYVAKEAKRTVEQVSERKTTGACKTSVLGPTLGRRGRPPSKRKKFKKTHGPDFEMPSLGKRGPSLDENATCDYCLKTDSANNTGLRDEILVCKDCNAKAHPSCMGYNETLAKRALDSPWQCIDCKTCFVCEDSGDADIMLFCDSCDKGYHMSCHNPPVRDKPQGKWECQSCYLDSTNDISMEAEDTEDIMDEGQVFEGSGASCLPTPCDSPVTSDDEEYFKKETKSKKKPEITRKKTPSVVQTDVSIVDNNYPDASKWTVDDVARFFTELGFKEQVEALREQEIDGQSLLLMKRSDVLTGLSIRLGPALKMYQHVMKLQLTGVDLETIS